MQILRPVEKDKKKKSSPPVDKSICVSDAKIDKQGQAWKRESIWFRQELLGKLKVVSHFEGKAIQQLIDQVLDKFVTEKFENSVAMRKMIGQSDSESK